MKLGFFGGTFDPIHRGHLRMARAAEQALGLDRIAFVPARRPGHKSPPVAGYVDRFAMLALALDRHPRWLPLETPPAAGDTYSVDEVGWLRARCRRAKIFYILGADSFATLPSWHRCRRLLALCDFIVLARPGCSLADVCAALPAGWIQSRRGNRVRLQNATRIHWLPDFRSPISSTAARASLAAPLPAVPRPAALVPLPVRRYAERVALYRPPSR